MDVYNFLEIRRYTNTFTAPDFKIKRITMNHYLLTFNDRFGYQNRNYKPEFWYEVLDTKWRVRFNNIEIISSTNPAFQLINELRGYTLLNNIRKGAYIIDAGASDGLSSKFFAALVDSKGRVLALEPDPNANLLDLPTNVIHVPACLAKKSGNLNLSLNTFGGSHLSGQGILVKAYSLADLLEKFAFKQVSFIKCDIEGAEVEIVQDLLLLVSQNPPLVVAIASYHHVHGVESREIIEKYARKYPKIMVKTVFPYHATTYLINNKNIKIVSALKQLPSYSDVYSQVWPHGENWNE